MRGRSGDFSRRGLLPLPAQKRGFPPTRMKKLRAVLIVLIATALLLFSTSGQFLIVNHPERADVIVVLAGETDRRPALGLKLLQEGYAPHMVLDVPSSTKLYQWDMMQLAQQYVRALPQSQSV